MTTFGHDLVNPGNHNVAFAPFNANSVEPVTMITPACVPLVVYFLINSRKDEERRYKTVTFTSKDYT